MSERTEDNERLEAMLSDYVEGTLSLAERRELEARLAEDAALREQLEETREAHRALRSLNKTPAPEELGKNVEDIIHRRSAGRFFGRRAFGDRVPFGVLLIVALVLFSILGYLLWSSSTGALKVDPDDQPRPPAAGSDIAPRP